MYVFSRGKGSALLRVRPYAANALNRISNDITTAQARKTTPTLKSSLATCCDNRYNYRAQGGPQHGLRRMRHMMIDWNEYHRQFGARVGELAKLSPDTVKGYQTLSAANSATTRLGEKTRQLISLAVAMTRKCDGCIVHHTEATLKAGATKEEIAEALGVAIGMNAGAALVYSTRVLDAVEAKSR